MENRVLHFDYDRHGKPAVPGAHSVIRESSQWWTVNAAPVNRCEPVLCYLWEEAPGLFGVYAEPDKWAIIDPTNQGVLLSKYFDDNEDWLTCRFDGSGLFSVLFGLSVPATVIGDPFTITEWIANVGDDLSVDQGVITIQRNTTTIQIRSLESGRLVQKIRNVGDKVAAKDLLGGFEKKERRNVSHRPIKLTAKPSKMPTAQKPLEIGDTIITNLYPSIGSSIGIGDRIAEAENG